MANDDDSKALAGDLERLDRELVLLIERRAEAAQKLGALREGNGDGPSPRPVPPELVARALEGARGIVSREILGKIVRDVATACAPLLEPARIAFCGPTGGVTHAAARRRFGAGAHLVQTASIDAALAEVSGGRAVFAVVPYERAPAGIVEETVRALLATELRVLACFDSKSRPHVEGESEGPGPLTPRSENGDGGELARYAVIGTRASRRSGDDRTALVFTLADDSPGALHDVLHTFKENDINLTHIDSRPAIDHEGTPGWSYLFFVETQGHVTDRNMVTAIDAARRIAKTLRVLGSFARE